MWPRAIAARCSGLSGFPRSACAIFSICPRVRGGIFLPLDAMLSFARVSDPTIRPRWTALIFARVSGVCFLPVLAREIFALVSADGL